MSKRYLKSLVDQGVVDELGRSAHADNQRIAPQRIHGRSDPVHFAGKSALLERIASWMMRMLEFFIREDLKLKAPRTMAVI